MRAPIIISRNSRIAGIEYRKENHVFGDSNVLSGHDYADGLPYRGWTLRVQDYLPGANFVKHGYDGWTLGTATGWNGFAPNPSRPDWAGRLSDIPIYNPSIHGGLWLFWGTNDLQHYYDLGYENFRYSLRLMIDFAVYVCGWPRDKIVANKLYWTRTDYLQQASFDMANICVEVAQEKHVNIYKSYDLLYNRPELYDDNIHYNTPGAIVLAQDVASVIPYLRPL